MLWYQTLLQLLSPSVPEPTGNMVFLEIIVCSDSTRGTHGLNVLGNHCLSELHKCLLLLHVFATFYVIVCHDQEEFGFIVFVTPLQPVLHSYYILPQPSPHQTKQTHLLQPLFGTSGPWPSLQTLVVPSPVSPHSPWAEGHVTGHSSPCWCSNKIKQFALIFLLKMIIPRAAAAWQWALGEICH